MHFESVYSHVGWPEQLDPAYAKRIIIFADGSCWWKTKEGAYAARIEYKISEQSLVAKQYVWNHLEDVTNQSAELLAIYNGLAAVPEHLRKTATVLLYTDSEWAVRCLNGVYKARYYHDDPRINWGMIRGVANQFQQVQFIHTKGHAGTLGNEECDTLCAAARKNVNITGEVFRKLMIKAKAKSRGS